MEEANVILLITVAASVLQIVLFFKVWAMTNDVSKLRNRFILPLHSDLNFEIRKLLALGNKEKVKEILLNRFFEKIKNKNYGGIDKSDNNFERIKKNIDDDFNEIKKELESTFLKTGMQLPEEIKNMKSGDEFNNLF